MQIDSNLYTVSRSVVDKYRMRNIDLIKLYLAGPCDHTSNFVQNIIRCSVNAVTLPEIDVKSGVIISRPDPASVDSTGVYQTYQNALLHFPEQIAETRSGNLESVIVCIMPAADDAATIAKIAYHTFWKKQIQHDPTIAISQWPELEGKTSDPDLCEVAFMSNVSTKCSPSSWNSIDTSAVDLVIDFKTVMGLDTKDLTQIICNFLEIPRQSEFDTFIEKFRTANQQYLSAIN